MGHLNVLFLFFFSFLSFFLSLSPSLPPSFLSLFFKQQSEKITIMFNHIKFILSGGRDGDEKILLCLTELNCYELVLQDA